MKRRSSLRRTAAPTPVAVAFCAVMAFLPELSLDGSSRKFLERLSRHPLHGFRAGGDRLDDVVVAGATAKVAFELLADGVLVELVALAADHVHRGHHHAGGTEAALQAVVLAERLLHR